MAQDRSREAAARYSEGPAALQRDDRIGRRPPGGGRGVDGCCPTLSRTMV